MEPLFNQKGGFLSKTTKKWYKSSQRFVKNEVDSR